MYPRILHLYGPIWINSYGIMIAIGFLLFAFFTYRHPLRKKIIETNDFFDVLFIGLLSGILGGRLLFVIENFDAFESNFLEIFYPWIGGFSLLGTIISILIIVPIYLKWRKVNILPFLDLISIYAPLLQAISRIGCFLAGCCYGKIVSNYLPWSVIYTNPESLAPLNVPLHPTQLYSTLASFSIFLILRFGITKKVKRVGQITFSYLILESSSRFVVDFWRGDRELMFGIFSFSQFLASILLLISITSLIWISLKGKDLAKLS